MRQRHHRRTFHTIHVSRRPLRTGAAALLLTGLFVLLTGAAASHNGWFDTWFYLSGISRILAYPGGDGTTQTAIINPYRLLDAGFPLLKANGSLSTKYEALKNESVRVKREANQSSVPSSTPSPPQAFLNSSGKQVLELDMGNKDNKIALRNETDYAIDVDGLLQKKLEFNMSTGGPKVLIVHTHTSESYAPSPAFNYTPTDTGRTEDTRFNVVRVGDEIEQTLKAHGINVIHDKQLNDYPSYNGSYTKTMGVINSYLEKYPTIEVVLDVHRDYTERDDGTQLKPVTQINGKKTAQLMFVVGTDAMGLEHPNWKHNLAFALQINQRMNAQYPMLARCVNIRTERFNQHATKGSMILEVGSNSNTLDEAIPTGQYVGTVIAEVLNGTK